MKFGERERVEVVRKQKKGKYSKVRVKKIIYGGNCSSFMIILQQPKKIGWGWVRVQWGNKWKRVIRSGLVGSYKVNKGTSFTKYSKSASKRALLKNGKWCK